MIEKKNSLKRSVITGAFWTLASVGGAQVVRLGKSLVLSRLLFPEAYGVMSIVWSVLTALELLSDVGFEPSIIGSKRGDDPAYLNTAWTLKVVRGVALCLVSCVIAYPLATFYKLPELVYLIPVAGLTSLVGGFCSTNIYANQRKMVYKNITILDFTNELVGTAATLLSAYVYPSVWSLLIGALVGRVYYVIASHFILLGEKNKFYWERLALFELLHFGKWIFLSSLVYLLYSQGDRLLLGKLLDPKTLGIYSVAVMLMEAAMGVITRLNNSVIFPAISKVVNTEPERLKQVFYRTRLGVDALMTVPAGILLVVGYQVVAILYDSRYRDAGWMLQIFCVRLIMNTMLAAGASCLLAYRQSQYSVIQNVLRVTWLCVGVPLVWPSHGVEGVVWVVALTEVPSLFVVWYGLQQYKVLSLVREMRTLVAAGVGVGIGSLILPILNMVQLHR